MSRNTVIVVEDEPLVRLTSAEMFAEAGINVVEFTDGDAAMDYLRDHKGDVAAVFTDVYLQGDTDGLELAGIVSEVCPDIAVLVTSGQRAGRAERLGPSVRYVPKPWHPADVLNTMRDAVRAAA
ncbi:response regulator [Lichenibacterium dinghuense]|uniref:response regulator n=1 Tax=Lichenibacterium dinghuense TaxID=2895977 RepID=UPI001F02A596|nr:response regulator [Lichenibacterium sp. 6Y81]